MNPTSRAAFFTTIRVCFVSLAMVSCAVVSGIADYTTAADGADDSGVTTAGDGSLSSSSSSSSSSGNDGSTLSDAPSNVDGPSSSSSSGNDAQPDVDPGPQRVTSGLVALYTFKETSGTVAHDVSNVLPKLDLDVIQGSPTFDPNGGGLVIASSAYLQSSTDALKIIDACKASNEVTLESWITPAAITTTTITRIAGIGGAANDIDVVFNSASTRYTGVVRIAAAPTYSSLVGPADAIKTSRQHLVMTFDATHVRKLYIDGALVASDNPPDSPSSTWVNQRVGVANSPTNDRVWLGTIHLVAFYSRALTQAEVAQNFAIAP